MILKSIEMQGFKSFADKIYLDFNSGITAIVGPNGSGKSNISDAIRWVMGEQSIKSLRGSKMEDVIFAGTEARKPLGFAEVTLNLNNEDHAFDIDFSEIQVTRRVYRSGESEYYINKSLCRLRDIHELFMDTGLGRDGYSIVGQGQIDSILSTKSEDRRQIFEEASGISKYKYRKNDAEKKLNQTTENISRVNDILGELESRLEPLEKQSKKAKKYLEFREEMKDLEINVSVINIGKKRDGLKKLKEDIDIYRSQIDGLQAEIDKNDEKVAAMYKRADDITRETEQKRNADKELSAQINELKNQNNLAQSEIGYAGESIIRLQNEIDENTKRISENENETSELFETLSRLRLSETELNASASEISEKHAKTGADIAERSLEIEKLKTALVEKTTEITNQKNIIESKNILIDSFTARSGVITNELSLKSSDIDNMKARFTTLDEDIKKADKYTDDLKESINDLEESYGVKNAEMQGLISEKNQNSIKLGQLQSKKKLLIDTERSLEGYSRGVKGVMNAYKKKLIPNITLHGPLSQLIKTDRKYVTAIETALGSAAQNIVADTSNDAKGAIRYLKHNNLGRATFLPISNIKGRSFNSSSAQSCPGFIGTADALVECNERYREIVSSTLSRTVIADTLDNAAEMGRKCGYKFKIVTLGGDIVQAGGAMTGGSTIKTVGSLSRRNEIEDTEKDIKKTESTIVEKTKSINAYSIECAELLDDIKNNNEKLTAHNEMIIKLRSEAEHLSSVMSASGSDAEKMRDELSDLKTQIAELKSDIEERESSISGLSGETEKLSAQLDAETKLYAELSGKDEETSREILELNIRQSTIKKDIELTNDKIKALEDEKSRLLSSSTAKQNEIQTLKDKIQRLNSETETRESEYKSAKDGLEKNAHEITELIELKRGLDEDIKKQQNSINDVRDSLLNLSRLEAKAHTSYENSENELEAITDKLWDEYELTYTDALGERDLSRFDYRAATKRISELNREIKALGNINIDSIEEYKEVKERVDFLSGQIYDLEKSKRELDKIIAEMLVVMKENFSQSFKVINESFNATFSELFGGGRAKLILVDPDNVLESGIEIEAQPPGKKLQSLTLLSGGERAFTAIALLFAILKVSPTPFCILDEIEAALDDVNVYRYARYLRQYSEKTQFIVITHRRGTMEAANVLYGVTMQEKGISKLLSLNIDEVNE